MPVQLLPEQDVAALSQGQDALRHQPWGTSAVLALGMAGLRLTAPSELAHTTSRDGFLGPMRASGKTLEHGALSEEKAFRTPRT